MAFLKKKYLQRAFLPDHKAANSEALAAQVFGAVLSNDFVELLRTIVHGADLSWKNPKHENRTALHQCVATVNVVAAELLLQNGARTVTVDAKRSSPLHLAASVGHPRLVQLLLACGADSMLVERDSDGLTPLDIAKRGRSEEIETALETAEIAFLRKQLARPTVV